MKTSKRFDLAIKKLYDSFHNNTLNPRCCYQCAVGNILDNTDFWKHFTDLHGSLKLSYVGLVHQNLGKTFNGYSPKELLEIEHVFLEKCGFLSHTQLQNNQRSEKTKDILFEGLSAVVSLLCRFDNITNVMNTSKLFDYTINEKVLSISNCSKSSEL